MLGPNVDEFEHKWAEISGLASCIGVANGVDAIEMRCQRSIFQLGLR